MGEKVLWDKLSHVGEKIPPFLKNGTNSPIQDKKSPHNEEDGINPIIFDIG